MSEKAMIRSSRRHSAAQTLSRPFAALRFAVSGSDSAQGS